MEQAQIIAMIVALTELSKSYFPEGKASKYAPLVAIVLGIAFGLYSDPTVEGGVVGLALGIGTTGIYKAADKFINKK